MEYRDAEMGKWSAAIFLRIRNSSANSVNQTSDVSRWISWWRNGKPCNTITSLNGSESNGYNTPR